LADRGLGAPALRAGGAGLAHTTERAFVLLLPTGYFIVGGTLAVAASFLVLFLVPQERVRRIAGARRALGEMPAIPTTAPSAASFLVLVFLLVAGWRGSLDPLANPLPLVVWTLWWVGLTVAQALFGDLWAAFNPWLAPYRILRWLLRLSTGLARPPLAYPARIGYWPAVIGFAAFAWFELVDPAPDNPARLAVAVAAYTAATLTGMLLYGEREWLSRAECFSVFFGFVARLSPLRLEASGPDRPGRPRLSLAYPGAALARLDALPLGGALFVLLTLASVSFDGLSKTFWWLGLGGINPLEFPGRTAVMARNSLGLLATWATLAAAYGLAVALGARLAGRVSELKRDLGAFVLSILPISIGYHFAHYLTTLLVNGQYAALAFNDPLDQGRDLLGLAGRHAVVSFLSDYHAVALIWAAQAASVVIGHILAVSLAHIIAMDRIGNTRAALLSQLPLAMLMIAYTWFGLWLLAAPTAG
jgi:hypothetical protein